MGCGCPTTYKGSNMSKAILIYLADEVVASQDHLAKPDLMELHIPRDFIDTADKCQRFLADTPVDQCTVVRSITHRLYRLASASPEPDLATEAVVRGTNGKAYVEFKPAYSLHLCRFLISRDGQISAFFQIKNTGDSLWCSVGSVDALKALASSL